MVVLMNWALRLTEPLALPARVKESALPRKKTPVIRLEPPPPMLLVLPPASVHRPRSSKGVDTRAPGRPSTSACVGRRPVTRLGAVQSTVDPLPMVTVPRYPLH